MAFEEITIDTKPPSQQHSGVSVSLARAGRSKNSTMRLTLHKSVLDAMDWGGQERLALLLGTGADHGLIRLRRDENGTVLLTPCKMRGKSFARAGLGRRPEFVDRVEKARSCNWEKVDASTIEIVLPAWADETRPKPARALSALPPQERAARKEDARVAAEKREADARRSVLETAEEKKVSAELMERLLNAPTADYDPALNLTRSEKGLLTILADRAGRTVSKEALALLLYQDRPNDPPDEKIVDVFICRIRPKLAGRGVTVETVWGEGYRLTGDPAGLMTGRTT